MSWLSDLWKLLGDIWDKINEVHVDPVPTPQPVPDPIPVPDPVPEPDPIPLTEIVVADLDIIPDRMRQASFEGSDGALWYALAYVAAFGPGQMPDDGAGSLIELSRRSPEIETWWNQEIEKVKDTLFRNPATTAIAIMNDGRDRCGFRLGPVIMERLSEFGGRVSLGTVVPESEY
jgi:hypothetical protein